MSYLVFARKWRPMQFKDVIAQGHVTITLENAIKQERLASAYLFSGPRGVGKTTTARIFAKAINCETGPTTTPCNSCPTCHDITETHSLDVFEIDGASNRGIDEVRNLRQNLKYAASKGKHKIYIIDEVHMLTTEAFNALLKTLEEPPPNVLFIFATTEPHKVPATILSRCQRYDFRRIPLNEIVEQLQKVCSDEHVKIDEESLFLIAKKSEGCMRDGLSILDQVVSFCGQEVRSSELAELLGLIDQELFFECTHCLAEKNSGAALKLVEDVFKQGYDIGDFLNGLVEHFRNMLVLKATGNVLHIEGGETYVAKYREVEASFSDSDLLRLISLASETSGQIKRSSNPKLLLEVLLLKMLKMDKSVELSQLLTLIGDLKSSSFSPESSPTSKASSEIKTASADAPKSPEVKVQKKESKGNGIQSGAIPILVEKERAVVEQPAVENNIVSLSKIQELWPQIIDAVKSQKIHLGSFLNEGYPTAVHEGALEISFGKNNGFHISTINSNKRLIQEIISKIVGFRLQIACQRSDKDNLNELCEDSMPPLQQEKQGEREPDLQVPILKKVIEAFDGEIVKPV
ncbi:MAG: DNA polymerase III subunit gamma/tau [bacterium]